MIKRFMLLVSCYVAITLLTTFLVSVPQKTFAEGSITDPPIQDTIQDTTGSNNSIPSTGKEEFKISYFDLVTSLLYVGI